jgi:hypothetical protein
MDEMERTPELLTHGDEELRRRLAAYADARLRPEPAATARSRTRLTALARSGLAVAIQPVPTRRSAVVRWRPVVVLLAAVVALGVFATGALALSEPGGPLYGGRLWVESITLPADGAAREAAETRRLEARLDEARAAAERGNSSAMRAAVAAYQEILDETLTGLAPEGKAEALEAVLSKHLTVLAALLEDAPAAAQDAIRNAIDRSDHALERLEERPQGGGGNPGQGGGGPGQGGADPGQGQGTENPGQGHNGNPDQGKGGGNQGQDKGNGNQGQDKGNGNSDKSKQGSGQGNPVASPARPDRSPKP